MTVLAFLVVCQGLNPTVGVDSILYSKFADVQVPLPVIKDVAVNTAGFVCYVIIINPFMDTQVFQDSRSSVPGILVKSSRILHTPSVSSGFR